MSPDNAKKRAYFEGAANTDSDSVSKKTKRISFTGNLGSKPEGSKDHMRLKVIRSDWPGISSIDDIVIFGDSYSASDSSPGDVHSEDLPSVWIDHLEPKLHWNKKINVHNFAVPGDTIQDDLPSQMTRFFSRFPDRPRDDELDHGLVLEPSTTLYVIWLGINDCGKTDEDELEEVIETLFDAVHDLYVKAGARNLLFIDVPPIDRSPGAKSSEVDISERYVRWNELLVSNAEEFASSSKKATIVVFSSHKLLTEVFDNPGNYGLGEDDMTEAGGSIWEDQLHLTSDVHGILAQHLAGALSTIAIESTGQ